MKRIYFLYSVGIALILSSGLLLGNPPTTVCAATCTASCEHGGSISTPVAASECSCKDNDGCTWTIGGQRFSQKCATKGDDEFETESPPDN